MALLSLDCVFDRNAASWEGSIGTSHPANLKGEPSAIVLDKRHVLQEGFADSEVSYPLPVFHAHSPAGSAPGLKRFHLAGYNHIQAQAVSAVDLAEVSAHPHRSRFLPQSKLPIRYKSK